MLPNIDAAKTFLKSYGWNYKESTDENGITFLITNYHLENNEKGILLSIDVQGEFLMVSTVSLLQNVDKKFCDKMLNLNDRIKLAKIYSVNDSGEKLDLEIGFELWNEAINEKTFFAFMDMLCLGIEQTLDFVKSENIDHNTEFVIYS